MSLRVVIGAPSPLLLHGLRTVLTSSPAITVLAEAREPDTVARLTADLQPDIVLADATLLGDRMAAMLFRSCVTGARPRFVVLAAAEAGPVPEAVRLGVSGILLHSDDMTELPGILAAVHAGHVHVSPRLAGTFGAASAPAPEPDERSDVLTAREWEVLSMIAGGQRAKAIAARLGVSPRTVDAHRANIMHKLGLHSVAALVRYYLAHRPVRG